MRRLAAVLVAFGAVLALATPSTSTIAAVSADCSTATATQLVEQHRLNAFDLPEPVRQVLCGPFMGPGSEAMAVTIGAPTCWPIQHWAIFGFRGGAWQLMAEIPAYLIPPLTAVGNDIREETAVNRPGDPRCLPTGGTHARLWHWDGAKFVAGAWTQVKPADPVQQDYFFTPSRNIDCQMGDRGGSSAGIFCTMRQPPRAVGLSPNGRLQICRGLKCVGNPGEGDVPPIRLLPYGKASTVGRFRCRSQRIGVMCVVIRTGKGFLINRSGVTRVG
jgi:hypothetical protein